MVLICICSVWNCYGLDLRLSPSPFALAATNQQTSQGFTLLYPLTRCLVSTIFFEISRALLIPISSAASASLVKLHYLSSYGKFGDFLWDSTELTIWSVTEVNVAITAASVPALKPLFKAILGSTYGSHSQQYPHKSWGGYAHQSSGRNDTNSKSRNRASHGAVFEMHNTKNSAGVSTGNADRERNKLGMDNVSEESILPLQGLAYDDKPGGIMKTTSVYVKSDEINPPRSVEDRV